MTAPNEPAASADASRPAEPPEEPAPAARSGWSFWRLRLARALLVGGVLYAALRFAPTLPHTQTLDFRAPAGDGIVELDVTLRDPSGRAQSAATLHPQLPQGQLRHTAELPSGSYVVELSALLRRPATPDAPEGSYTVELERPVRLEEHTVRVELTP